jgi:hypothetical protein
MHRESPRRTSRHCGHFTLPTPAEGRCSGHRCRRRPAPRPKAIGVLDSEVSRSTCSWATSTAHFNDKEREEDFIPTKKTLVRRCLMRRTTTNHRRHKDSLRRNPTWGWRPSLQPPAQSRVHEGIRQEEKHASHAAPMIRWKRIYNFWCSMLVLHRLLYVLFTLHGISIYFLELTY